MKFDGGLAIMFGSISVTIIMIAVFMMESMPWDVKVKVV